MSRPTRLPAQPESEPKHWLSTCKLNLFCLIADNTSSAVTVEARTRRVVVLQDCVRPGGTERQSAWLARSLQAGDYTAKLLLFQQPPPGGPPPDADFSSLQHMPTPFAWFAPGLIRRLRELQADLVICMGRNANCYAAWIRRRMPGTGVISTCRTSRPLPFLYRHGVRGSDFCVANSEWSANQVIGLGLKSSSRIGVIPNALLRPELLDLDRAPAAVAAARSALGLPADCAVLCNIASFVPGKNKQALLRAFARSRSSEKAILLLAGAGVELGACRKLAGKLRLGDRVRFLGHTEEVERVLQASDLFVSTALRDGLPNALVEAQAAGLPVISYDTGGSAEVFLAGESGLSVPAGDETAFAKAVDALVGAPKLQREFSARARSQARERFHPGKIATAYDSLIRRLLAL